MGIGVMPMVMVVVVVVTVISMRMRRMAATQRDWHTIGLTGTSALELTQIAAIGQSLNMVMVAGLGKAHFRLKTQHLCSVFTERAIHRCLTTEHFIHPLHKGVLDPDVVSEIGSMQKFHLGVIVSDAFTVLANSGEDEIVFSSESDYAANIELAEGELAQSNPDEEILESQIVDTGEAKTVEAVTKLLEIDQTRIIKTLLVYGSDEEGNRTDELIALLLRGDQELNETKAQKLSGIAAPLRLAEDDAIKKTIGCPPGSIGPQQLSIRVIADHSVVNLKNFTCGANKEGKHIVNLNWSDSCKFTEAADLRKIQEGDLSPDGKGTLFIKRGIEVGHIFQLGKKYSESLNAKVLDEKGKATVMPMGCYGIGITRIVAACIEQSHDDKGIIWPENISPFHLIIVQIDAHKSNQVKESSEQIYAETLDMGMEVLLDDRDKKTSPGVKFAESELIGIPHRVVISPRSLADGVVEYTSRSDGQKQQIKKEKLGDFLAKIVNLHSAS